MTIPKNLVARKLGELQEDVMTLIDERIGKSLGLQIEQPEQTEENPKDSDEVIEPQSPDKAEVEEEE